MKNQESNSPQKSNNPKYSKITQLQRNQLLNKVFYGQNKIKDAAKELGINYSSAKTILHLYRKCCRLQNLHDLKHSKRICRYKNIKQNFQQEEIFDKIRCSISIISTLGGKSVSSRKELSSSNLESYSNYSIKPNYNPIITVVEIQPLIRDCKDTLKLDNNELSNNSIYTYQNLDQIILNKCSINDKQLESSRKNQSNFSQSSNSCMNIYQPQTHQIKKLQVKVKIIQNENTF